MATFSGLMTIAVIGGTGKEGKGLASRWAKAGYRVLIGSRSLEKALLAAQEIRDQYGGRILIEGMTNLRAAEEADIAVLTVPFAAHHLILESVREALQGKIVVDVTAPLSPPELTKVQMPPAGSAAQEAHVILGDNVQVTSAFQNISYENLLQNGSFDCDVLVTGTSQFARNETLKLVKAAGFTGWDAGSIENSVVVEGLTSVLIYINRRYGLTNAGIKITGVHKGR